MKYFVMLALLAIGIQLGVTGRGWLMLSCFSLMLLVWASWRVNAH